MQHLGKDHVVIHLPGSGDTATVVAALSRHVRQLPATLRRSLTWDRGLEMARIQVTIANCPPQDTHDTTPGLDGSRNGTSR
jgi:IS30 family transposase